MQHTWFVPRTGTWLLRRNSAGGYNVSDLQDKNARRCPTGAPPARPYISPGHGKTLDDLRREGLARYDPAPK